MSDADDAARRGAAALKPHDGDRRISEAMATAERVCAKRGAQLTPIRRRVLEFLLESDRPIGAYALLSLLREDRGAAQAPTIYRALDFLVGNGLAHKVTRLNAYAACCRPEERHAPQLLICADCERISEITDPAVVSAVGEAAQAAGFAAREEVLEIIGVCADCRDAATGGDPARQDLAHEDPAT